MSNKLHATDERIDQRTDSRTLAFMGLEEDRLFIAMVVLAGLATVALAVAVMFSL